MQEFPEANHRVTNCNCTGNTKPIAINTNTLPDIRFLAGQAIDEIGSVGEPKSFVALNHQVARPSQTESIDNGAKHFGRSSVGIDRGRCGQDSDIRLDRKSTRLNSSHSCASRMPSSA